MPRYTKDQLGVIARALKEKNYEGAANTIWWWRNTMHPLSSRDRKYHRETFPIMTKPIAQMPLYINDNDECTRIIATARLSYKKED